jgi:hypothetical protein
MALLTLGDIQLDGFEVPASIAFGGAQRTAVHKLLGGARVIDTMGRDDAALAWRGVLTGAAAGDRARTLDAMRVAGNVLSLAWDSYCYDVVISRLDLEFCSPWWITYEIECTVVIDLAQGVDVNVASVADDIIGDLGVATGIVGVASILGAAGLPGALSPGAAGIPAMLTGLSVVQSSIAQGIGVAEQGLDANDVPSLVRASGSLAQLCQVQGFVDRSVVNLQGILG